MLEVGSTMTNRNSDVVDARDFIVWTTCIITLLGTLSGATSKAVLVGYFFGQLIELDSPIR